MFVSFPIGSLTPNYSLCSSGSIPDFNYNFTTSIPKPGPGAIDSILGYRHVEKPNFPVKYQKLNPLAIEPRYSSPGAAGMDFFTYEDFELHYSNPVIVSTGISMEVPVGYGLFIFSRSGQGFKADVRLANCVGVIDSDYRGEIKVKLTKDVASWAMPSLIKAGDAIAQGVFLPYKKATLIESSSLSETERGSNGFGSTDQPRQEINESKS